MGAFKFGTGSWEYYLKFGDFNTFALSGLQNFLGKIFTLNNIYNKLLLAVKVNDVDRLWFYIGEMGYFFLYFPKVDTSVDNPPP